MGVRKSIWLVKIELLGAGMVTCQEQGANDLDMVQLMPLLSHHLLLNFFLFVVLLYVNKHDR